MKGKASILAMLTLAVIWANIEIPKRAFRFYEKGDLDKTVEALERSMDKDSLNPAANYLYAVLYVDTAFWGYHVDSAYAYINEAIRDFGYVTEAKDLSSLADVGVDSVSLEVQKDLIDSLQFELIKAKHTIADYNWFRDQHADAKQVPDAIRLRNHIAFEDAEQINTWQSYFEFMGDYPDAEDFEEAENRYKKLIFDERTADGKLQSYLDFIDEFPATPYYAIAERQIFELTTAINSIEAYTDFLRQYPNEALKRKILPRLYHLYKQDYAAATFFDHFDLPSIKDSLQQVIDLEKGYWLPEFDEKGFGFFQPGQGTRLAAGFEVLPDDYLCDPVATDFVTGTKEGQQFILGRNGNTIYQGGFESVTDLGYGFLRLEDALGHRLMLKTGDEIITEPVEDIAIVTPHFIRTLKEEKYGLSTINQKTILSHEFVKIDTFLNYIWLEKEQGIALVTPETLFPAVDGAVIEIDYEFEDIFELDNGYLLAQKEGKEAVLDKALQVVVPYDEHEVYERDYGWLIKKGDSTRLLHKHYPRFANNYYQTILENDQWLAIKEDSTWALYDQQAQLPYDNGFDSLAFWGENMVMLYRDDAVIAQFRDGQRMPMEEDWTPSLLVPQSYIKTGESATYDFFMLTNAKNYRKVYNSYGREILSATYRQVNALGPDLLRLQKRNTALVDSTGNFVLNFIYNSIGSYDNGYVSILKSGKVGIVNVAKKLTIPPTYEGRLEPYSDTLLVAPTDGLKGFISASNEELSGFDFDEVRYWNDSVALVRIEEEWILHDIPNEEALVEGINEYELISEEGEGKRLLISTEAGKGIYAEESGMLIEATYDEIRVLGTTEKPVYFAVKIVAEADLYVVIYFDKNGERLFTRTYQQSDYNKIACRN